MRSAAVARPVGWLLLSLLVTVYLALYVHLPVELHPDYGLDDGWFYEHARLLTQGRWFGPYSEITLAKGPGYAFFLALDSLIGLPVILSQALLQVGACGLFAWGIRRISGSTLLAVAVFVVCLWHPYLFSQRVIRDAIYAPETLLFLGCLLQLLAPGDRGWRLAWSIATGLAFAWFWLTREEGVWILPGTVLLGLAVLWRDRSRWRSLLATGATAICIFGALAACNFAAYRTWSIVDFKGGAYSRAVNALQSVRVGAPVAFVPAPAKVRIRIYEVSPAFATLRPYLEGAPGHRWTEPGCQIYPATCGDIAGGWFTWALRAAAAWRGLYRTPADADRFYATLASEVNAACRAGRLTCNRPLVDFLPQMTASQWRDAPAKLGELADFILAGKPDLRWNSSGGPVDLREMWEFTGYPRRTPAPSEALFTVSGWYRGKSPAWIQVRCGGTVIPVEHLPSPDVAQFFHDPAAADDRFTARSIGANCALQAQGGAESDPVVSMDGALPSGVTLGSGQLFMDARTGEKSDVKFAQRKVTSLIRLYRTLTPVLLAAAAIAYIVHLLLLARRSSRFDLYWWTVHALWLMIVTRCVILGLVDISSFPGLNVAYLAPVFPLVMSAAVLTIGLPFRGFTRVAS